MIEENGVCYLSMKECAEILHMSASGWRKRCRKLGLEQRHIMPDPRMIYIRESDIPRRKEKKK